LSFKSRVLKYCEIQFVLGCEKCVFKSACDEAFSDVPPQEHDPDERFDEMESRIWEEMCEMSKQLSELAGFMRLVTSEKIKELKGRPESFCDRGLTEKELRY